MKIIKKIFNKFFGINNYDIKSDNIKKITLGNIDKDGFAETYIGGEKSNTKLLVWNKSEVEKLWKIQDKIHQVELRKKKIDKILNNG